MKLSDLLKFDDIVIQCHDNPDADALSSGYALHWYLEKMGKKPRFIYRGHNKISKSNILIMMDSLKIPVSYEPDFDETPELLVTVDCQYGQTNVTKTNAQNIAIIDHHQITVELPELSEVRSNIGCCDTVIWDMIREEGLNIQENMELTTALYYGLYTDTNKLTEISHPLDKDMRDSLIFNKSIITEMCNSNISLDELKITGKAILEYEYHSKNKYLIINAEQCDPNILGVISDFTMETTDVNVCLAYYISPTEVKFSVRSCTKEVHANELAAHLANGLGGGGGHLTKAGGALRPEKIDPKLSAATISKNGKIDEAFKETVANIFNTRLEEYFAKYTIIYAQQTTMDTSDMKLYQKVPQKVGCVKLSDVFPVDTIIEVRTLEGDINTKVTDEKYLMIGITGEVYPIAKEKLERSYQPTNEPYNQKFEYEPSLKNVITGEKKYVLEYAQSIISTGKSRIYAKPINNYIKLFTVWDEEKYYLGEPGDYIAVRDDDPNDLYIINSDYFDKLYTESK